jgi:hypothetical protein
MNLSARVADQPRLMAMCIEPVNLETRAILLAAPAAATLYIENVHIESMAPARRQHNLRRRRAFLENVIVNCINRAKRFSSYFRTWYSDSKRFFHAHNQLERVDGIQAESFWTKKWEVIADLLRSHLQHQIFYKHLLDLGSQIVLRHK